MSAASQAGRHTARRPPAEGYYEEVLLLFIDRHAASIADWPLMPSVHGTDTVGPPIIFTDTTLFDIVRFLSCLS
jgi:hypothetical protein